MRAVLLAPHNDDETLFAAFTCLRERPHVITVLRSETQDAHDVAYLTREAETKAALAVLGCTGEQWPFPDVDPDWDAIAGLLARHVGRWRRIYAPAVEPGGHPQHSRLGQFALEVFGASRVTRYLTYTGSPAVKTVSGREVTFTGADVYRKLVALACYKSQMMIRSGSHIHFAENLREYYA